MTAVHDWSDKFESACYASLELKQHLNLHWPVKSLNADPINLIHTGERNIMLYPVKCARAINELVCIASQTLNEE